MFDLVSLLGGIAIVSGFIAGLAYIQSRSGEDRRERYLARMRRFMTLTIICCVMAAAVQLVRRI